MGAKKKRGFPDSGDDVESLRKQRSQEPADAYNALKVQEKIVREKLKF